MDASSSPPLVRARARHSGKRGRRSVRSDGMVIRCARR
jgi:hypothetical protein